MNEETRLFIEAFEQAYYQWAAQTKDAWMRGRYVLGKTGTGKTTYLLSRIINDLLTDWGLIVIDPKGDLITDLLPHIPVDRRSDVRLLDVTNTEQIFGFNFLDLPENASEYEVDTAVSQVMEVFGRLWGNLFTEIPVVADVLLNTCHILAANPGYTLAEIPLILDDDAFRERLLENVTNTVIRDFWEYEWKPQRNMEQTRTTRSRVRAFLADRKLKRIIGQTHSTVDFSRWIDEQRIVLIRIPWRWFGEYQTTLLGTLLLHSINKAIEHRIHLSYQERKDTLIPIYIDEYHRVMNKDTADLLTEGRGYGVAVVLAHQTRGQLENDPVQLGATLQAGTSVCFQLTPPDADVMAGLFDHTPPEPEFTLAPDAWAALGTRGHNNPKIMEYYRIVKNAFEVCCHGIKTQQFHYSLEYEETFTIKWLPGRDYYTGERRIEAEEACRELERIISDYLTQVMHQKVDSFGYNLDGHISNRHYNDL
jgi:hypothetical protein